MQRSGLMWKNRLSLLIAFRQQKELDSVEGGRRKEIGRKVRFQHQEDVVEVVDIIQERKNQENAQRSAFVAAVGRGDVSTVQAMLLLRNDDDDGDKPVIDRLWYRHDGIV